KYRGGQIIRRALNYRCIFSDLVDAEKPCCAHSATDTHGDDAVAAATSAQLAQDGCGHAGSGHAERVSKGDGATVGVDVFDVESELTDAVQRLGCKGFVEFDDGDVVDREIMLREQFAHG